MARQKPTIKQPKNKIDIVPARGDDGTLLWLPWESTPEPMNQEPRIKQLENKINIVPAKAGIRSAYA